MSEVILLAVGVVYVAFSYWLMYYAAKHDAKLGGTSFWEAMPPCFIVAPIFAPFVLLNILAVKRYIEPRFEEEPRTVYPVCPICHRSMDGGFGGCECDHKVEDRDDD
jgi:hypothetical protein